MFGHECGHPGLKASLQRPKPGFMARSPALTHIWAHVPEGWNLPVDAIFAGKEPRTEKLNGTRKNARPIQFFRYLYDERAYLFKQLPAPVTAVAQ